MLRFFVLVSFSLNFLPLGFGFVQTDCESAVLFADYLSLRFPPSMQGYQDVKLSQNMQHLQKIMRQKLEIVEIGVR